MQSGPPCARAQLHSACPHKHLHKQACRPRPVMHALRPASVWTWARMGHRTAQHSHCCRTVQAMRSATQHCSRRRARTQVQQRKGPSRSVACGHWTQSPMCPQRQHLSRSPQSAASAASARAQRATAEGVQLVRAQSASHRHVAAAAALLPAAQTSAEPATLQGANALRKRPSWSTCSEGRCTKRTKETPLRCSQIRAQLANCWSTD